jgi:exodeoxyribonuclease-3
MSSVIEVASWNVNSVRTRMPRIQAWLNEAKPTILCLQETKVEDALFPTEAFTSLGYNVVFHGQKSYNGVAILSREPLTDTILGFGGNNLNEQSRVITATTCGLRIINAYVPNGEALTSPKFAFKEEFYRHLTEYTATQLAAHPKLVLCGDFNIAADDRDVANPARAVKDVLFTPAEQAWLQTLRENIPLNDSFRLVSEEAGVFSWWDYRSYARNPNAGMRIDYLFTSPALKPHVTAVTHDLAERTQTQPSDHVPVTLKLTL